MTKRTILLVEDEETLARALHYTLEQEGYSVTTAKDGAEGLAVARQTRPDLVLLDLMLPTMNGFEVCRALRNETTIPILILTAKVDEIDKIVGLELGADDYVTKPFSTRELLARIKAHLRRASISNPHQEKNLLSQDGIVMDVAGRTARIHNSELHLRPKEFDLLAFLLRNRGIAFSREILLERVWSYDYLGDSRTVDVHVRWLREKIEADPGHPTLLLTVRGIGYKLKG